MDDDGDGIITTFDLEEYWEEQEKRLYETIEGYAEDIIRFDDLICQLNDLIRPQVPGQFRLSDLKRNGIIAERFFDTFLNIEKFQVHDTYQGLIRANQQLEREKKRQYELEKQKLMELQQHFIMSQASHGGPDAPTPPPQSLEPEEPFSLGAWCDYAEQEYDLLLLNEQCSNESIDSEWSLQQHHNHQHLTTAVDGDHGSEDDDDNGDDEVDEDVESPNHSNCSSVTDESSGSSSTPTTPVMQHEHDHKQPSLQQARPSQPSQQQQQQQQQRNWDLASY
ncbi:hypothetical protein MBANPS3_008498 [Mucor bainieri]